jgi:hypothetical protein
LCRPINGPIRLGRNLTPGHHRGCIILRFVAAPLDGNGFALLCFAPTSERGSYPEWWRVKGPLKPGNRRHVAADMRLRCQLLPIGRDTRDAGRSRHRSFMRWRLSIPAPHGVDADESVGERSQRIGAWWKPEEHAPRRICPPSHRLNGMGSSQFGVRRMRGLDPSSNSERRTSPE